TTKLFDFTNQWTVVVGLRYKTVAGDTASLGPPDAKHQQGRVVAERFGGVRLANSLVALHVGFEVGDDDLRAVTPRQLQALFGRCRLHGAPSMPLEHRADDFA